MKRNKEIILKITNEKIWFNETDFIDISCTDIPFQYLKFNTYLDIFWKVEMKDFDKSSRILLVDITNYNCRDYSSFINQKPKSEIKQLNFNIFNWKLLEPLLSNYQKIKFIHKLRNYNDKKEENEPIKKIETNSDIEIPIIRETDSIIKNIDNRIENIETNFIEEFAIDFNDSYFMLGYVRFSKYIKKLNKSITFKIKNDNILAEFDNIKYWFSKKLKIKKFKVRAIFILIDNKIKDISATSKDIDNIDQNLIEGIKVQRTLDITKSIRPHNIDKALFTSDDLFSLNNDNDLEGNVFKQSEKDILEMLIDKCNARNKREIAYLSGRKQSLSYRIRFTNHPNFGFIFLAEGELNNHFIWELLESHATYIWTIEKGKNEIELQYKRIENIINTILIHGRDKYKRAYKTTNQDNDLIFNVIYHKDKGSEFIDEFPKWKHRINELIT